MTRRRRLAGTLAILALAAFFRLHRLDTIPPGLFGDEASDALVGVGIARGEHFPIYVEEPTKWGSREPLYHYWMAVVLTFFGDNTRAVRLASALAGIATVVAFHSLCRQWLGGRTAFAAAALLAVARWHVTMSRVGMRPIMAPLWAVLTLLVLTWLIERPNRERGRALGVTVGLGMYTYPAYWVVPPLLGILLFWRLRHRRRVSRRLWRRVAGSAALAALLTAAPLIGYAIVRPDYFFARATRTFEAAREGADTSPVRDNFLKTLLMMHVRGDENARHNLPGSPMLDPVMGGLFAVGVWHILRRLRTRFSLVRVSLFAMWLVPLLPSALTDSAPHAPRAAVALLAACVLSAFGLARAERWLVPRHSPVWRGMVTAAILALVAVLNYRAYFDDWAQSPAVAAAFSSDILRFYDRVEELAAADDVYASAYIAEAPQVRFLGLDRDPPIRLLADESALLSGAGTRDRVLVSDSALFNQIVRDVYPDAEVVNRYAVDGESRGLVFRIPRANLKSSLPPGYAEAVRSALAERGADGDRPRRADEGIAASDARPQG